MSQVHVKMEDDFAQHIIGIEVLSDTQASFYISNSKTIIEKQMRLRLNGV
jgi:hypothetical protein